MRQVVVRSIDDITVEKVPEPMPGPGEVLVRSKIVGICGSDMHAALGRHPYIPLPYRPGHEVVGVVEALGPDAPGVEVGNRVLVEPNLSCGECAQCQAGRYNICQQLKVFGCQTAGAMADRFTIPADRLHTLPDEVSDTEAALVEPLATAVHAVRRAGELRGRKVAVLGSGPIGLLVLAVALRAGAVCVTSDLLESKRKYSLGFGARESVPADASDFATQAMTALEGPADVVFDCVGCESSMAQATDVITKGGAVMVVGVPPGPIPVRLDLVQDREISILGNLMYVRADIQEALALIAEKAVPAADLVTAMFPIEQAREAFTASRDPEHVKVVVVIE